MSFEQEADPRVGQVTQFLRAKNISLWEEPHWRDGQANISQELVNEAANTCHLTEEAVLPILLELQQHALQRIEDKKLYEEKKLMTIHVKIARNEHTVRISETDSISELFVAVAALTGTNSSRVRLIYQGRMLLNDHLPPCMHNVKSNAKMVGLIISADVEASISEGREQSRFQKDTEKAKRTAKMASAMGLCEITNQFGNKVDIPEHVRLSLTCGLVLHNKARTALDKGKPHDALAYLLEAETIFNSTESECPQVLASVGNVAQLHVDVVWCFLEIGSLTRLSDAERRLRLAEEGFNNSYGRNLEKVTRLKGSATNELTQLTRLQLLKGVAAFYRASYAEAKACFEKANLYMQRLFVDETHMATLVGMGYPPREARLALREANNSISAAMELLLNKQEQRRKENERWERERLEKHLKGLDRGLYKRLIGDLGVSHVIARRALLEARNDYKRAEELAMELEIARKAKTTRRESETSNSAPGPSGREVVLSSSAIAELVAMGETEESAKCILEHFMGDLESAQNFLLSGEGSSSRGLDNILADLRKVVSKDSEEYLDSTLEKEMECFNTFMLRLTEIESSASTPS